MRTIIITASDNVPAKEALEAADKITGRDGIVVLQNRNNTIFQCPNNYYFNNVLYGQRIERNRVYRQL